MRTTLIIDDDLLAIAERLAAERSVPVDAIISELIRNGLSRADSKASRYVLPTFHVPPGSPPITSEDVRRDQDEL